MERTDQKDGSWALWAIVAAIGIHVIEEYALNFTGWARHALAAPVTSEDFHLVNAGVTAYAVGCAVVGWRLPAFSLSAASLVVLNATGFHGLASILFGYSPGTLSAALLFVPLGVHAYVAASRAGLLTWPVLTISVAAGVLWHAFLAAVFYIRYFMPLYP